MKHRRCTFRLVASLAAAVALGACGMARPHDTTIAPARRASAAGELGPTSSDTGRIAHPSVRDSAPGVVNAPAARDTIASDERPLPLFPAADSAHLDTVSTADSAPLAEGEEGNAPAMAPRAEPETAEKPVHLYRSVADSLRSIEVHDESAADERLRIVVSLGERRLWLVRGAADTLLLAPVAIGADSTLSHGTHEWYFGTPRSVRRVIGKGRNPVWIPPDWHYVEVAGEHGFKVARLRTGERVPLANGRTLAFHGDTVGVEFPGGRYEPVELGDEIIADSTIYIPPVDSRYRRIRGELGAYKLEIGNGFLLHGTPDESVIGTPVTHGCLRLREGDIDYLFHRVPIGTPVYIY